MIKSLGKKSTSLFFSPISSIFIHCRCHLETLGSPSSASSSLLSYDRSSLKLDQQIGSDSSSKNSGNINIKLLYWNPFILSKIHTKFEPKATSHLILTYLKLAPISFSKTRKKS